MLRKLIVPCLVAATLSLSGCGILFKVHRLDIQQGNIIAPSQLRQLHTGMTTGEAINVLGQPVLNNTLNNNEIIYVYTWQPGYSKMKQQYVKLYFSRGRMTRYTTNIKLHGG